MTDDWWFDIQAIELRLSAGDVLPTTENAPEDTSSGSKVVGTPTLFSLFARQFSSWSMRTSDLSRYSTDVLVLSIPGPFSKHQRWIRTPKRRESAWRPWCAEQDANVDVHMQ